MPENSRAHQIFQTPTQAVKSAARPIIISSTWQAWSADLKTWNRKRAKVIPFNVYMVVVISHILYPVIGLETMMSLVREIGDIKALLAHRK
jgi:hypothetical protein